jgi:hypothetical protein
MATISLFGWGTDLQVTQVSTRVAKELARDSMTDFRIAEIQHEGRTRHMSWSGFEPDPAVFKIYVDDQPIDSSVLFGLSVDCYTDEIVPIGKNYLVCWESQKGWWSEIKTRKKIRPDRFTLNAESVTLPDRSRYRFMELSFDGQSEFGGTVGKDRGVYLITPEGQRLDVNLDEETTI